MLELTSNYIDVILPFLTHYQYWAVFLGSFILGQGTIFTILFLSAQGVLSPFIVFWVVLVGNMCAGLFWYLCGTYSLKLFPIREPDGNTKRILSRLFGDLTSYRLFLALFLANFLYGFRFLVYLLIGAKQVSFLRFSIYLFLGSLSWLIIFFSFALLAQRGLTSTLSLFNGVQTTILIFVTSYIVFKVSDMGIRKYLSSSSSKRNKDSESKDSTS